MTYSTYHSEQSSDDESIQSETQVDPYSNKTQTDIDDIDDEIKFIRNQNVTLERESVEMCKLLSILRDQR